MNFTVAGNRIICSRKDNTVADEDAYRRVVEFDAQVDTVPPHVAARLTTGETEDLKAFITDRQRIQANPTEKNMLEVLPGLLQEAADVLDAVESINKTMYETLFASIARLSGALDNVKPVARYESTPVNRMRISEAQKERLENIKKEL